MSKSDEYKLIHYLLIAILAESSGFIVLGAVDVRAVVESPIPFSAINIFTIVNYKTLSTEYLPTISVTKSVPITNKLMFFNSIQFA